jgi:hypothetical protein
VLGVFFYSENGGNMFLQNISELLPDNAAQHLSSYLRVVKEVHAILQNKSSY